VNWYVIEDGDRLTVLDAGFPGHWSQLPSLLASIGRSLADIDAVLLTHQHADHIGVAERVRTEAHAPVFVHEADAEGVRKGAENPSTLGMLALLRRPFFARYLVQILRDGGLNISGVEELTTFTDGELLDVPGRPRVIHAPGHTAGECALHIQDRDVLFSGDSLVTLDTSNGKVGPVVFGKPFTADVPTARESLARLEATGAGTLLPGHGEPWNDGVVEAVRVARAAFST
jgi:glyoxylase-like metal-dependent hydrolase (beta-lactamase superfamily II)